MFWFAGGGSHAVDFMYSFWLKFGLSGSFRNRCLHLMLYSKRLRELLMLFVGFLCFLLGAICPWEFLFLTNLIINNYTSNQNYLEYIKTILYLYNIF